jgi:hypothetical protein
MSKITDKEELMLVSDLYETLKVLMEDGRGNWKIKIGDRYLYIRMRLEQIICMKK